VTRGFVRFLDGCEGDGQHTERIWYVEGSGTSWTRAVTPYTGSVMAVAWDTTGTYLLHNADGARGGVRVTKRTAAGVFTGGRQVSSLRGRKIAQSGDLAASGGLWWAVWSEAADYSSPDTELFQARTVGPDQRRTRITRNRTLDHQPTIALRRSGATLAWARARNRDNTGQELRVATSTTVGSWRSRRFERARPAGLISGADLATSGTTTFLTWTEGQRTVVADNGSGAFNRRVFSTPGFNPKVRASHGRVFVAWETPDRPSDGLGSRSQVLLAERNGTTWTSAVVSPDRDASDELVGLSAARGRAAVLYSSGDNVRVRIQQ
jgi:hypothetical protein